ncbi:MAG: helix-turn-helix domain-containing protein [Coriobacteriia bacterium]
MDELLTIEAVARYLGVSTRTVYNHVRAGDLPAVKVGRLWRVRAADLEAWLSPVGVSGRTLLELHRGEIAEACRRHSVIHLDAFGSVLRDDFTAESDIDLLVEFADVAASGFDHPYWSLVEELETIFGRRIDLVMASAVTNPYLADELEDTREVLYAA